MKIPTSTYVDLIGKFLQLNSVKAGNIPAFGISKSSIGERLCL